MSKIFIDANVLLEIQLKRNNHVVATNLVRNTISSQRCYSALTGHLLQHFRPKGVGINDVRDFLDIFELYSLLPEDFSWAYENRQNEDFEDALQLAVAVRNGCDYFYTFDKDLVNHYQDLKSVTVCLVS